MDQEEEKASQHSNEQNPNESAQHFLKAEKKLNEIQEEEESMYSFSPENMQRMKSGVSAKA